MQLDFEILFLCFGGQHAVLGDVCTCDLGDGPHQLDGLAFSERIEASLDLELSRLAHRCRCKVSLDQLKNLLTFASRPDLWLAIDNFNRRLSLIWADLPLAAVPIAECNLGESHLDLWLVVHGLKILI